MFKTKLAYHLNSLIGYSLRVKANSNANFDSWLSKRPSQAIDKSSGARSNIKKLLDINENLCNEIFEDDEDLSYVSLVSKVVF